MLDYTMLAYNVIRCLTNNGLQSSVKKLCKAITTNLKDKQGVHTKDVNLTILLQQLDKF